jgi:hypothetical protein
VRDDNVNRIAEIPERAALLENWLWSSLHPDDAMVFGSEVTDADAKQPDAMWLDGSIQLFCRYTEETTVFEWTPEEAMIQRVLANPIAD